MILNISWSIYYAYLKLQLFYTHDYIDCLVYHLLLIAPVFFRCLLNLPYEFIFLLKYQRSWLVICRGSDGSLNPVLPVSHQKGGWASGSRVTGAVPSWSAPFPLREPWPSYYAVSSIPPSNEVDEVVHIFILSNYLSIQYIFVKWLPFAKFAFPR